MAVNKDEQVYTARVRQLYGQTNVGIIATMINAFIITAILYDVTPHSTLIIWLAVIILTSFLRLFLFRRYRHSSASCTETDYWLRQIIFGISLSGITWGLTAIILFPTNSIAHQVFIAFVVGGMVAGAAGAFSVVLRAFIAFSLPALSPIIIRFFIIGDNISLAMGGMTLLFGFLMFVTAKHINKMYKESLTLKFENAGLVTSLRVEKEQVQTVNELLNEEIRNRKRAQMESLRDKKTAESANRAKSEFLANMSHELRTPLNHIIGFTELVVDRSFGDLNAAQEEYLGDVLTSSRHLLSLINDILDLSKVEAGKLELELSDIALKVLLENSIVMIKEKAMKHGIQLSTDIDSIPETITADERKLKQIIYNLLSNAVKFTPKGGEIHLAADLADGSLPVADSSKEEAFDQNPRAASQEQTASRKLIQISVTDTGIGIKPEDLEKIFSPFEQVDNSASRRFQGTGLGLSLTRRLVELHGGRIWAESQGEGKGSSFRFMIPV